MKIADQSGGGLNLHLTILHEATYRIRTCSDSSAPLLFHRMKYRFVGGKDVPEWILAEVSVLSKISCVRLKLICRQVISELVGGVCDMEKVDKLIPKDLGFTWSDTKATIAAISFILTNATKFDVDHEALNAELQQLGLPKENSDGISRPYRIHRDKLTAQTRVDSFKQTRLVSFDYRLDQTVATSITGPLRSSSGALQPVSVLHVTLGVADRAAERTPVHYEQTTPLLLSSGSTASAKRQHLLDRSLVALGAPPITKIGETTAANTTSILTTTATASDQVHVNSDRHIHFSMSGEQARSLLTELRVARRILTALESATATNSAANTGAPEGKAADSTSAFATI